MKNKDEVKKIIQDYIKADLSDSCRVNPEVLDKTFKDYIENYPKIDEEQPEEDYITEAYEYYLNEFCEHEEYEIIEDEDYEGRGFRYAWCPYCNKSASIEESVSEDGPEQTFNWE